MIILNTGIITKSGGLYNLNADQNLTELKAIMKNIIVKERPHQAHAAVWASDLDKNIRKTSVSTQTDNSKVSASTQTSTRRFSAPSSLDGGRIWAKTGVYGRGYKPHTKKEPKVKTFAL